MKPANTQEGNSGVHQYLNDKGVGIEKGEPNWEAVVYRVGKV